MVAMAHISLVRARSAAPPFKKSEGPRMPKITIYTTAFCPFCHRAKALLKKKNAAYEEIGVDFKPDLRREMAAKAGKNTVPQIWIGETHVGGCDELHQLEADGKLDPMLAG
jgi:glutaredoxin 3